MYHQISMDAVLACPNLQHALMPCTLHIPQDAYDEGRSRGHCQPGEMWTLLTACDSQ